MSKAKEPIFDVSARPGATMEAARAAVRETGATIIAGDCGRLRCVVDAEKERDFKAAMKKIPGATCERHHAVITFDIGVQLKLPPH